MARKRKTGIRIVLLWVQRETLRNAAVAATDVLLGAVDMDARLPLWPLAFAYIPLGTMHEDQETEHWFPFKGLPMDETFEIRIGESVTERLAEFDRIYVGAAAYISGPVPIGIASLSGCWKPRSGDMAIFHQRLIVHAGGDDRA